MVAFRQKTRLPPDDVLGCLRQTIPDLSRSAPYRCLQRHADGKLIMALPGDLRSLDKRPVNLQD